MSAPWETYLDDSHKEIIMKLWLGNLAPGTSDDEIRELLRKYAPDLECVAVHRMDGDGSRPAVALDFGGAPLGLMEKTAMRLHGMYWKGRGLYVQTLSR
jgi:hypothetical protein